MNILRYIFRGKTFGVARSGKWKTLRKHFVKGKTCAVCETKKRKEYEKTRTSSNN